MSRCWNQRQGENASSTRFCMGAAWKNPNDRDMPYLERRWCKGVKALGLESCMTLGTLTDSQAQRAAEAGLDYYNHNLEYLAGILRQHHHHPHLPGAPGYAG